MINQNASKIISIAAKLSPFNIFSGVLFREYLQEAGLNKDLVAEAIEAISLRSPHEISHASLLFVVNECATEIKSFISIEIHEHLEKAKRLLVGNQCITWTGCVVLEQGEYEPTDKGAKASNYFYDYSRGQGIDNKGMPYTAKTVLDGWLEHAELVDLIEGSNNPLGCDMLTYQYTDEEEEAYC